MKVRDVCEAMDGIAPPHLAAVWDNVGLLIGRGGDEVRRVMLCIDLTAEVMAEAVRRKAEMIVAYHPVIFEGLKRLTESDAPAAYGAARRGVAVYSPHTALDAAPGGTCDVLAEAMGLTQCRPLEPTSSEAFCKVVAFVPPADLAAVAHAAHAAGAGYIGDYSECSFFGYGIGTFRGGEGTSPAVGRAGQLEAVEEARLEVIAPSAKAAEVCAAIREAHSYEEPAIDVVPLRLYPPGSGMGRVGRLARPMRTAALVARIKKATGVSKLLLARPARRRGAGGQETVATAACCPGSCGAMFRAAAAAGATFYLTGEMRHHDALAATALGLTVACLGHSHSERLVLKVLASRLRKALKGVSISIARCCRDPFEVV